MDLGENDLLFSMQFRYVVILLGNNDLGKFENRAAVDPKTVALKLVDIQQLLHSSKSY